MSTIYQSLVILSLIINLMVSVSFLTKLVIWQSVANGLQFLFAGDFQGAYKKYTTGGGVARMKQFIDNDAIFVYVGNFLNEFPTRKKAELAKQVFDIFKPAAVILGKQELHLKPVDLDWYIKNVSNVIVSVNLEHKKLKPPQLRIIKRNNIGIAILGYTSESTDIIGTSTNFYIKNIVQSLNDKVREITLTYRRVRLIVAAGCGGLETAKQIAEKTSSVHIVLSSCSRTLMWHDDNLPKGMHKHGPFPLKMKNRDGYEILVCHTFGTNQFLGEINITLTKKGKIQSFKAKMIHIDDSSPEDSTLSKLFENEVDSPDILTGKVGKTRVFLDGSCTKSECNLGNMVADAFVQYVSDLYNGEYWTDAPIAIVPGTIIRSDINTSSHKGQIMVEDLASAIDDIFELITFQIRGSDLYRCFEQAINFKSKSDGAEKFLQVSGIRLIYDSRRNFGNRIVSLKARCAYCHVPSYEPVKNNSFYNVTSMTLLSLEQYNLENTGMTYYTVQNVSNFQAVLRFIARRKFVAPANNDRISQQPLVSSTMRWLSAMITITLQMLFSFGFSL